MSEPSTDTAGSVSSAGNMGGVPSPEEFDAELAAQRRSETWLLLRGVAILIVVCVLVVVRAMLL